ncbi:MAG: glycosyltransferase [Lewinellaceae bacterium]|nr:glycosyltransferase [Lewinellaceae bacterium]
MKEGPARIICTVTTDLTYDQRMARTATALTEAGYQVRLVGRQLPASVPLKARPYEQTRLSCWFLRGKAFYLEFNLRLCWLLLFSPVDIICAVDLDTLGPACLIGKLRGKKIVYDAHEYFSELPELTNRPFTKRIWEWLAAWCIPLTDRAYTVGPALAEVLQQRYQRPFGVVRNVPLRWSTPAFPPKTPPPILLYQGALNMGRGLEALLEALPLIPDVELWIAGEGDLSAALRQQVQNLGLTERVKFLGYLVPEALAKLTPQAWLGINLLENRGLNYYLSLANKAFDYIQAGVPALHMDFPEYRNLATTYGGCVLVDNLDPRRISQVISELRQDPHTYARLQQACLKAAESLHWDKEKESLIAQYAGLVEQP